ncbi:MAG: dihydrodipicolinate synthase family protein [Rhodothermales bacterium]
MSLLPNYHGVCAVPPVARRNDDRTIDPEQNLRMLRHLAAGGISRVIYGGNGNLYHMTLRDYEALLECLSTAMDDIVIVPSVGPAYGRAMEQAEVLRRYRFPLVMALPGSHPCNAVGLGRGYREIAEAAGAPLLLYVKDERDFGDNISAGLDVIGSLVDDGVSVGIKYAVVREDPAHDPYLKKLLDRVDADSILSGIGERPALVHMQQWGLPGFTTGSGCVQPTAARALYDAAASGDFEAARKIRARFMPLEDLRDQWGPVSVLHAAVEAAGIARVGPPLPFLGDLSVQQRAEIASVVESMLDAKVSV